MWEVIKKNQRKSFFLLAIMAIVLISSGFIIGYYFNPHEGPFWGIFLSLAIYFILLIVAFSSGSSIILRMSKAKQVGPDDYPQLYNIVEEMRISAGMPYMPKVYVIDDPSPNAFAAGMNPKNSVVAVTTGLMRIMNRDELQGVVAHEISHIINRDVRYMTLAIIMVGTVALISQIFLRSVFYSGMMGRGRSSGSRGGGKGNIIMMVIAIAFAILAPIAIRLLYFAISRKREYLADASAARLTRYPEGLASALQKIANSTYDLASADKTTAPMYIANPLKSKGKKIRNLSSTHPPLEERIRILRTMGQEHSLENYQLAYKSVTNSKSKIIS